MRMKPAKAVLSTPLLAASMALGGCASSVIGDPFVAPRKFQYLRCEDIAKRLPATAAREQELRTLMERSSSGAGGSTVNLFVYQPDYQSVSSELRQLHEMADEKHCPPLPAQPAKTDASKTDAPPNAGAKKK